jgi:hypothetical protein
MELNDQLINGLTDEEIEVLASLQVNEVLDDIKAEIKAYSAGIKSLKEANPKFKDKTLKQLVRDNDFQQTLKEYREQHPSLIPLLEPEKIREILRSIIPKIHVKPNTKLSNQLKNLVNEVETELVINNKSKNEVTTKVVMNYKTKNIQMSSDFKFTAYDREVYDGVITLYVAGNLVVTPPMVYRAMNGLTETENISDRAVDEVRKSLDKSSFIKISIDYTDEAKLYHREIDKTTYVGYLLACEKLIVETGGKELEGYKLLRSPILYEYAQISGQIVNVPINLLNTKGMVNSTEEVIVIRGYLLRQIAWMKHKKVNRSSHITYQGVYDELEIFSINFNEKMYKEKTFKIRNHVKSILKSWQTQEHIKNFEEYKDGKQIKGVKIYL